MRKVSGFLMLLLVVFLISIPAVAEVQWASNGQSFTMAEYEIKIDQKEEVPIFGETLAVVTVGQLRSMEMVSSYIDNMNADVGGIETVNRTDRMAGGVPTFVGGT